MSSQNRLKARKVFLPQAPGIMFTVLHEDDSFQVVRMKAKPGAVLPLHSHVEPASMHVIGGEAKVLADDGDPRKDMVLRFGDGVRFGAKEPHGYIAGPKGFVSISVNHGILGRKNYHDIRWH